MKKVLYIFGTLTDDDIEWLIANGKKEYYSEGDVIIERNSKIRTLYIALDGVCSIFVGKEKIKKIAELKSGEIIGEMSFVDSSPTSATVVADSDLLLYSISTDVIHKKILTDSVFGLRFYHAIAIFLADRLRAVTGLYGYGSAAELDDEIREGDELDDLIIDNVALAGDRFRRMLKRMIESA